jgi:endonuclease YncB( thermonuclease family)
MNIYTPSAYTPISPSTTHPQTPNAPSNAPVGSMACTHTLAVSEESLWQYPHPATYPSAHLQNPNTPSNAPVSSVACTHTLAVSKNSLWLHPHPPSHPPTYKTQTHLVTHQSAVWLAHTHIHIHIHICGVKGQP